MSLNYGILCFLLPIWPLVLPEYPHFSHFNVYVLMYRFIFKIARLTFKMFPLKDFSFQLEMTPRGEIGADPVKLTFKFKRLRVQLPSQLPTHNII